MKRLRLAALAAFAFCTPALAEECPVHFNPSAPWVTATCTSPTTGALASGVALGIAMAAPTYLGDKENFAVTGNWGGFDGANAFATTGIARIKGGLSVNAGVGYAPDTEQFGYRAGVRVGW